eukprot:CAMPEP_0204854410 /NCGR_PEP_ID=MMETSP1347-20130617/15080_1 /ASSEMBLY_ACC=CAM_ASM_000690 /TAXON_ID=215587 /ORGANISM="Aplanochytrium stocchinoi, Strain GSBS06" /LENGTH=266 /DNA_ID=CAMNT_0051999943 /DNA_START=46 /DNA_END=843 /DNA_ORIENTATION=-
MSYADMCENFDVFMETLSAKVAEVPLPGPEAQFEMLPEQWKTKKFKDNLLAMASIVNRGRAESAVSYSSQDEMKPPKLGTVGKMKSLMNAMSTSSRKLFFPTATKLNDEKRKETMKTLLKTAVLILFYPGDNGRTEFCLTRRNHYEGTFSGDVCLPGGKAEDEDSDLHATATRETFEEVGVPMDSIEIIAPLTAMYAPNIHAIVYPFIGCCKERPAFQKNEREVAEIVHVPLSELMGDGNIKMKKKKVQGHTMEFPTFEFRNAEVW